MNNSISTARPDVVALETAPRPTAPPVRVPFSQILSSSALALVEGAQVAARTLPGAPVVAAAVRGGGLGASAQRASGLSGAGTAAPEGPTTAGSPSAMLPWTGAAGAGLLPIGGAGAGDGSIDASLAQSQQLSLYYLQIQQQVNDQNRTFTLLSNVIEMEHNTAKTAIGNIH
jgi:hypothetical protein